MWADVFVGCDSGARGSQALYTWRKQPAFQAAVDELSREAFEATAVRARNLMLKATRTLGEALCGNERFAWAIRIANSKRLWEIGQVAKAEADDVEPQNESPADGAVGG